MDGNYGGLAYSPAGINVGSSPDSADVTAMKRGGMTSEYLNSIDSKFRELFHQGISGDIFDKLKSNRATADAFWQLINSGALENKSGNIVMKADTYNSDPALAKLADSFGYVDQVANTKLQNQNKLGTDFKGGVDSAVKSGFITQAQADSLNGAYGANPEGAQAQLNTWVSQGLSKQGAPAVPAWQYSEPDIIKQYKDMLKQDLAINPQMNPDTVKTWLPLLQEAQAPAKQQEYDNNAALMNSMGRLNSGQTLGNSQTINNKYTMDALNKALGFAGNDYATQIATKNAAKDKALALGQYETGISQYGNNQDVTKALQDLMNNWNTINTNKSQNYNDVSGAINRVYANQDWTKSADLSTLLAKLQDSGSNFDWTKLLGPAATVGAAAIGA